jgi:hypothetical protein
MWKIKYLEHGYADYFDKWLPFFKYKSDLVQDNTNNCLSKNCFATKNLLKFVGDNEFLDIIEELKSICEKCVNKELEYFYLHMIDYENGGEMSSHKHDHNEDYSFILYLNSCEDGDTLLHLDPEIKIKPVKDKMVLFSSDIVHSAIFSNKKRILVGGLKLCL